MLELVIDDRVFHIIHGADISALGKLHFMTIRAKVIAIHVGLPRSLVTEGDSDTSWISGIFKSPVYGSIFVGRLNIEGDEQADLVHHGGVDKAVLVYPSEHYSFWTSEYPKYEWQAGCFGENLTLNGLAESDVCIGDVFHLGQSVLQVSQPRQPCWKLSRRWNLPKLAVRVQETRLTGWYLRVLQEGRIEAGQEMQLSNRLFPQWTVQHANEIMFAKPRNRDHDQELAACPALSQSWRDTLTRRVTRSSETVERTERGRLEGT